MTKNQWIASGCFALALALAIQVHTTLANGDWPIQAIIGGIASPAGTILSVHQ